LFKEYSSGLGARGSGLSENHLYRESTLHFANFNPPSPQMGGLTLCKLLFTLCSLPCALCSVLLLNFYLHNNLLHHGILPYFQTRSVYIGRKENKEIFRSSLEMFAFLHCHKFNFFCRIIGYSN